MLATMLDNTQRTFKTAELRALTDEELQARFLRVRLYLTRNNTLPARFRAPLDAATRAKQRRFVSESSRILHLAAQRGLKLRYPTWQEMNEHSVFKVQPRETSNSLS
jgi:hypothetical protein